MPTCPCLPGPRALQALHRPPGWGQVNAVVARSNPVPRRGNPRGRGQITNQGGTKAAPRLRGGGKPSTGKGRLMPPHSRTGRNVEASGMR